MESSPAVCRLCGDTGQYFVSTGSHGAGVWVRCVECSPPFPLAPQEDTTCPS